MYDKPIKTPERTPDQEDVYEEPSRDEMVDDDEITPEEDGFMDGYEHGEAQKKAVKTEPNKKKERK